MTQTPSPTFTNWLLTQTEREGPIGALAYEASDDADFPSAERLVAYREYLQDVGAMQEAHNALDAAWFEFEQVGL